MNEEEKNKVQAAAEKLAAGAFSKAKLLTGWKRWAAIIIGTLAAGAAAWLMTGCMSAYYQTEDVTGWILSIIPLDK